MWGGWDTLLEGRDRPCNSRTVGDIRWGKEVLWKDVPVQGPDARCFEASNDVRWCRPFHPSVVYQLSNVIDGDCLSWIAQHPRSGPVIVERFHWSIDSAIQRLSFIAGMRDKGDDVHMVLFCICQRLQ